MHCMLTAGKKFTDVMRAENAACTNERFEGVPVVGVETDGGTVVGVEQTAELNRSGVAALGMIELVECVGDGLLFRRELNGSGGHDERRPQRGPE